MIKIQKKDFFLGILTYFKNERHVMKEWILHYKKWGVDHIWMIDNGSKDDYDISEFVNDGFVTVYKEPILGQQSAYNKYYEQIKKKVKWLGVFDMDEFLYSKENKENDDLKAIVSSINQHNKIISIQMTIFFPATFETPISVIESNILRKNYDSDKHPKCLFNLDLLNKVSIHGFDVDKKLHLTADKTLLCINHYRYTSFEYLYGIKEGRGGGVHKKKYQSNSKFMTLIDDFCSKKKFLSDDFYLKNHSYSKDSKEILYLLQHKKPKLELYPNSSFLKLKNDHKEKYNQFKNYNKILTHSQINEINLFLNDIAITNDE